MLLEHVVFTLPDALTSVQILIDRVSGKVSPDVEACLVKAGLVVLGFASVQILIDRASGKVSPDVDTHCLVKAGLVVLGFANDQVLKHGPQERSPTYTNAPEAFDPEVATLDEAKEVIKAMAFGETAGIQAAASGDNPIWWKLIDLIPEILKDLRGKYFK